MGCFEVLGDAAVSDADHLSWSQVGALQELTVCRLLYRELRSPIRTRALQIQAKALFFDPESFSRSRSLRPAPIHRRFTHPGDLATPSAVPLLAWKTYPPKTWQSPIVKQSK